MFAALLALTVTISPAEAVALAASDAAAIGPANAVDAFYVWHTDPTRANQAATCYAVNMAVSHATRPVQPVPIQGGVLHRYSLRTLCPQDADYRRVFGVLQGLADVEPYFHVRSYIKTKVKPYRASDGRTYDYTAKAVSQPAEHVGPQNLFLLETLTGSRLPIVRADWFLNQILTTVDGGKYYDLLGLRGKNQADALALAGADEKLVEKLRADQRTALLFSGVTGRSRRVDAFYGLTRPEFGPNLIGITHDIRDQGDGVADKDPLRNLLVLKDDAREIIFQRQNGTFAGVLTNGEGVVQDSAPEDVAHDSTVPSPHPQVLQAVISCIACHGPDEGRKTLGNDVQALYQTRLEGLNLRGNIFGDTARKGTTDDTLDRLAGLYAGSLEQPIRLARDSLFQSCFLITGGQDVPTTFRGIKEVQHGYAYGRVDAAVALAELGIAPNQGESATAAFNRRIKLGADIGVGYLPIDPHELALRAGKSLSRKQWEAIFADVARRAE